MVVSDESDAPTDEEQPLRDRKYTRLARWLETQPAEPGWVRLPFAEVERILEAELPPGARQVGKWWANDSVGHVQSLAWLAAGWRVSDIDFDEQVVEFSRIKERQRAYIEFFSGLVAKLRQEGRFTPRDTPSRGVHWQALDRVYHAGRKLGLLAFSFSRTGQTRIELYIDTGDRDQNKSLFDALSALQEELHSALGTALTWERIDSKQACRVAWYHDGSITDDSEDLERVAVWAVESIPKFNEVVRSRFEQIARSVLQKAKP